jgi:acyl carrier protein
MTRDDVLDVIKKHTLSVLIDLDGADFDPSRSLRELGAKSLDVLEIVSASMKTLRVKVPRTELNHIENLGQLADVLLVHVNDAQKPA